MTAGAPVGARLNLIRAGYGAMLTAAPAAVARAYTGRAPRRSEVRLARVLGVRQLVQALVSAGRPGGCAFRLGALVDAGHALSALAAARLSPPLRRAALIDTALAAAFAAGGIVAADRCPLPRTQAGRRASRTGSGGGCARFT